MTVTVTVLAVVVMMAAGTIICGRISQFDFESDLSDLVWPCLGLAGGNDPELTAYAIVANIYKGCIFSRPPNCYFYVETLKIYSESYDHQKHTETSAQTRSVSVSEVKEEKKSKQTIQQCSTTNELNRVAVFTVIIVIISKIWITT